MTTHTTGSPDISCRNGSLRCALFTAKNIPPTGLAAKKSRSNKRSYKS